MILLDTNVISDPLKVKPDIQVTEWLDNQIVETLFLSTISLAELYSGIAVMADGKRKALLKKQLEEVILPVFEGRILSFDQIAAEKYAQIKAKAKKQGRAIGVADGYIAAIACANNLSVATRDISPFDAAGLDVINPWNSKQK